MKSGSIPRKGNWMWLGWPVVHGRMEKGSRVFLIVQLYGLMNAEIKIVAGVSF